MCFSLKQNLQLKNHGQKSVDLRLPHNVHHTLKKNPMKFSGLEDFIETISAYANTFLFFKYILLSFSIFSYFLVSNNIHLMETMRKLSLHKKVGTIIFMLNPTQGYQ